MKAPNLHLNLLHASERQSSSPVRLRVMLPVLALLACVGCLVWWGVIAGQLMLVRGQVDTIKQELDAKKAENGGVLAMMTSNVNMQAEIDQLSMYVNGRRVYGKLFTQIAETLTPDVQLLKLEIPLPPPQNLQPPGPKPKPGQKVQPLLGPTNTVETVVLTAMGATTNWRSVDKFKDIVTGLDGNGVVDSKITWPDPSKKFEITFKCKERGFEK